MFREHRYENIFNYLAKDALSGRLREGHERLEVLLPEFGQFLLAGEVAARDVGGDDGGVVRGVRVVQKRPRVLAQFGAIDKANLKESKDIIDEARAYKTQVGR